MADKKPTMMGKLLSRVHSARYFSRLEAENALWDRNKLSNPTKRQGYKLAETDIIHRDGTEYKELRLYKLIDAAVVKISSEVNVETTFGLDKLRERQGDEQNKSS